VGSFPEESRTHSRRVSELARRRAEEKGIPIALALIEIHREYPELREAARQEVLGLRLSFKPTDSQSATKLVAKEPPSGPVDFSRWIADLAAERAKEKGIPYRQALCEISREDPELADLARRQVMGLKLF